jgi:hypothetical protein
VSVHSNQLAATSFSDTTAHSIYTVPSTVRTIVKSIVVRSAASSGVDVSFIVRSGSTNLSTFNVFCAASGTNGATQFVAPWIVLLPGQVLQVQFNNASGGWVTVSGSELAL